MKKIIKSTLLVLSSFFYIIVRFLLLYLLSKSEYTSSVIWLSILDCFMSFIFSVIITNMFVTEEYKNSVMLGCSSFMHSLKFHDYDKGTYLQKVVDYPQNFMFMKATILEGCCSFIVIILFIVFSSNATRLMIIGCLPVMIIALFIFFYVRKDEEKIFMKMEEEGQKVKDNFLSVLLGFDNIKGSHGDTYVKRKSIDGFKAYSREDFLFNLNQYIQNFLFSYSGFILMAFILVISIIFPDFYNQTFYVRSIISVKTFYALLYQTITQFIEIKMYRMYSLSYKKDIADMTGKPFHEAISECCKSKLNINPTFSLNIKEFYFQNGDKIQIHGKSGSGKSCMLDYIMGLRTSSVCSYEKPFSGSIAYVGQSSYIFNGDFWENMFVESSDINEFVVNNLWKYLHMEDDLLSIKKKSNLKNQVSSGQEAVISYTRAILSNPDLLVLDEIDRNISDSLFKRIIDYSVNHVETLIVVSHEQDNIRGITKHITF